MKKILAISLVMMLLFLLFSQNKIAGVKSALTSSSHSDARQRLEFFEKLSREYYGSPAYGEELDLVNRAVDITRLSSDLAELIIPSRDAIDRLKARQTLAAIESRPPDRFARTVASSGRETPGPDESKTVEHSKSSMLFLVIGLVIISAVISLLSYLKFRSKTRRSALLKFSDDDSTIRDDSILIDFDLASLEEKNQPPNLALIESVN